VLNGQILRPKRGQIIRTLTGRGVGGGVAAELVDRPGQLARLDAAVGGEVGGGPLVRAVLEPAEPDLRALQVGENGQRPVRGLRRSRSR